MPAVGITEMDRHLVHVTISVVPVSRSAWLVVHVDTLVKAISRETHSPSRASKTYGHNAFQIIHIHTTVVNSGRAHTTQHRTHCGAALGS